MALGATACNQIVFDAFLGNDPSLTFFHGHSYTANPIACAAGLASLDLLEKNQSLKQIETIRNQHMSFRDSLVNTAHAGAFQNIRILGSILAFELNTGKNEYTNEIGLYIMRTALSHGIYLRPLGNTVYLMPPYCILPEQLEKIYDFILSLPEILLQKQA